VGNVANVPVAVDADVVAVDAAEAMTRDTATSSMAAAPRMRAQPLLAAILTPTPDPSPSAVVARSRP
jgi:hypothetical protein